MKRPHRKLVHWIAAASIVMSALAPAVSQAISFAKGEQAIPVDVCSAVGHHIQVNTDTSSDQTTSTALGHCPFCVLHADFTPAPSVHFEFQTASTFAFFPELFYQSPQPLSAWLTPPSAAPPIIA